LADNCEEIDLVERAKTDPAAFGELYNQFVDRIYNYVYYRTGNHYDAEDLTAKVFFQALKHLPTYEQRGLPFAAWLYRIAHNLVANWHRDRSRRKVISLDRLAAIAHWRGTGPFDYTVKSEQQEALLEAVRDLPDDRQQLLILKYIERLPNAQIGDMMGRSEGAIKSLYHRTLVSLRQTLDERGFPFRPET
jgi:RNA polymerase sigma-70 factor (ECF subfamily)